MGCNCKHERVRVTSVDDPDFNRTGVLTGSTTTWPAEAFEIEFDDDINSGYRFKYFEPHLLVVLD